MKSTPRISTIATTLVLLIVGISSAAQSVRVAANIENEKADFKAIPSGSSGNTVRLDFPAIGITSEELGGRQYQQVQLPAGDKLFNGEMAIDGEPAVPLVSTFLAVPDRAGINYTVEYSGFDIIEDIDLAPTQPSTPESGGKPVPFTLNSDIYSKDEFYPTQIAQVADPVIMRDVRMVQVIMYPVQYNPVRRQLKVYRDLHVAVTFDGDNIVNPKTTRFDSISDGFYPIYKSLIANFDQFYSTAEVRRAGILVIAKPMFVDSLKTYANWKRRKGYKVHVAPTTEINSNGNPTANQIQTYIRNAYNDWEVPPEYVMIVGDQDNTSNTGVFDIPYNGYTSDHQYSTLEGNDYLPDLFISRFSIDNMSQFRVGMAKIMDYETHPYMEDLNHWRRGLSVAGNVYASTPRLTVLWVRQLLLNHGFTRVDTSFKWNSGDYDSNLPGYFNGGPCFVSYRGWAGPSGWYSPMFQTDNLNSLQNTNKLAPMASIVCGTGHFGVDECFGEKWIRMGASITSYKGGPVFFGATDTNTHTRWNNPILVGFYFGIFQEEIYHFAAAAVRGKILQYNTFPRYNQDGGTIEQYFNTYNMLGDPELEIRTTPPELLNVMHPDTVNFGLNYLAVNVSHSMGMPIEGAYVSLYKEVGGQEEMFAIDRTDLYGDVHLQFDAPTSGNMILTVSGRNLYPYQSTVSIVEGELVVAHDSHLIDDDNSGYSSGNGDGIANPGETIELSINLKNFSPDQSATNIRAELIPIDDHAAAVYDAESTFGDIAPGGTATSETPFVIRINPDVRQGDIVRLKIVASDDQSSWESAAAISVAAPKFVISNIAIQDGNGRLDPGETVEMVLTLRNSGSIDAAEVTGTVSTIDDYTHVGSASGSFGDIPVDGSGSNSGSPMVITADISAFDGRQINLNLHAKTASGAESDVPFTVTVGAVQTSDPTGPDAYGYYMYDNTDNGYAPTPTYNWVDITVQGTRINYAGNYDDNSKVVALPFDFRYYGEVYTHLLVCTNGFAAPDTDIIDMGGNRWSNFYNWPIPDPGSARGQISPFWDDLSYSGNSYGVYTWHDTDNHRFVIEWYHMSNTNSGAIETFEMIITDPAYHPTLTGDSEILYLYNDINNNDSGEQYGSVGFENFEELAGIEYTFDNFYGAGAATLIDSRAIKITTNTGRGAISGNVDLSNSGQNQGVLVSTTGGQHRITPQSGDYWIKEVPVGLTDVTAGADGYFPATINDVNVTADMTAQNVDFALTVCPSPTNLAASEGLGDRIELTWNSVNHQDLAGYDIFRSAWENGLFEKINIAPVSGQSFTDSDVPDNGVYWYYLTAVFAGDYGDAESFGSNKDFGSLDEQTGAGDGKPSIPKEFFVSQNYPNPFNPSTVISYGLPGDADVRIEIFNVLGQNVRTLVDERQAAGYKSIVWNGDDNSGSRVSSGVYFYSIEAGNYRQSKKMMLIK